MRSVVACQLIWSRELFKTIWPCAGEWPLTRVHAVVRLQVRGLAVDLSAAAVRTPVPFVGAAPALRVWGVWRRWTVPAVADVKGILLPLAGVKGTVLLLPRGAGSRAAAVLLLWWRWVGGDGHAAGGRVLQRRRVLVEVQQAPGDGQQGTVILPGVPESGGALLQRGRLFGQFWPRPLAQQVRLLRRGGTFGHRWQRRRLALWGHQHRRAVGDGHQALGSHEVGVGDGFHGRVSQGLRFPLPGGTEGQHQAGTKAAKPSGCQAGNLLLTQSVLWVSVRRLCTLTPTRPTAPPGRSSQTPSVSHCVSSSTVSVCCLCQSRTKPPLPLAGASTPPQPPRWCTWSDGALVRRSSMSQHFWEIRGRGGCPARPCSFQRLHFCSVCAHAAQKRA